MILCGMMVLGINCGASLYRGGCGVKSRKCMRSSKSAVLLEREKSDA